jgi:integrase
LEQIIIAPTSDYAVRHAWDRLVKRAGIVDLRFHDLRHEAVSRFFEMGLSVPEVALISGHKDYRMLASYNHTDARYVLNKIRSYNF